MNEEISFGDIIEVDLEDLLNSSNNTREKVSPDREMIRSIREKGILHPVAVREPREDEPDQFHLVDGHRRVASAKKADRYEVVKAVYLGYLSEEEEKVLSLIMNRGQKKLKGEELYNSVLFLKDRGMAVRDITDSTGISRRSVERILKVENNGRPRLKKAVRDGEVDLDVGSEIASLTNREQDKVLPKVRNKSRSEAMKEVRRPPIKKIPKPKTNKNIPGPKRFRDDYHWSPFAKELCQDLEKCLDECKIGRNDITRYDIMLDVVNLFKGYSTIPELFPEMDLDDYEPPGSSMEEASEEGSKGGGRRKRAKRTSRKSRASSSKR